MNARNTLLKGVAALNFSVSADQIELLLHYLDLLNQWNKVHNLTAVRDAVEQVKTHLLDCLALLPFLPQGTIADIGTGAGLPALIIAIMQPERKIYAVEANIKKSAFLRLAISALQLKNVTVVQKRVEDWHEKVDVIVSRAMAEANQLLKLTKHLSTPQSTWLLMKAQIVEQVNIEGFLQEMILLKVPLLTAERHLLKISCI